MRGADPVTLLAEEAAEQVAPELGEIVDVATITVGIEELAEAAEVRGGAGALLLGAEPAGDSVGAEPVLAS